jgi:DNA polymerase-1
MPTKKTQKKKLVLLDAHAIIHRAYHALPDFSSSKGEPTGALYGISTMIMSLVKEFKPDYMVAAFDLPKPTYRHEAYADYKSGRKKADDNLVKQLERSRDVFKAFNIPIYEKEGYEADDVLGAIVEQTKTKKDIEVIIASGDMDTLQLVEGSRVKVFTLRKGIKDTVLYDEKAVKDRFGFKPEQLIDYKGLRGDTSDNIIGVPGIGEKTATDLILNFKTIEKLYAAIEKNEDKVLEKGIKPRIINLLKENEEEAMFSKTLATIQRDVPIKFELPKNNFMEAVSVKTLKTLFDELEFRSLNERVSAIFNGGEIIEEDKKENDVSKEEVEEIAVALWVLDSNMTNPTVQDILHFAGADDFEKAKKHILGEIKKQGLEKIYEEIEKPLIPVITGMKEQGILIDKNVLKDLSKEYHKKLEKLQSEIWEMADNRFNINSPKQMAEVLFNEMELKYKGMRKTSSGSYSTKEEVLQKLIEVHPIAEKILDYRELQKLLSTYIDNIPKLLDKDDRLRANFQQTGTVTGRMSSKDPNLQNIPIKSELGRRIRNAFVAPKGCRLVAFDYSQIELRLAAILSNDPKLIKIFKDGDDVHRNVAAYVFKVKPEDVDSEMRRKAKTINFGILYGMGVTALQKNLKTDRKEAQKFYDDYFDTFTGLASYLDTVKSEAARKGYTETLLGRRRYFEGLKSSLPFIRAQAERMAINAPIQGTSADVIKIAMVKIDEYLNKEKLNKNVSLIHQIHDEVIYEVKEDLIEKISDKVREIMESVLTEKQTKGVPIIADGSVGKSWGEMKSL